MPNTGSLTGTNPNTPASSYYSYFNAITSRLNESYPTGPSPRLSLTTTPTTIKLAIPSVSIYFPPENDTDLGTFLRRSIYNSKEIMISRARNLNKYRDSRLSNEATSFLISIDPDHVPTLLPAVLPFSKHLTVKTMVNAN